MLNSIYFTVYVYLFCVYMGIYGVNIYMYVYNTQVFIIQFLEVRKLSSENIF